MKKSKLKKISTLADLEIFSTELKEELGLGFHPDDPFEDYINVATKEAIYSKDEARSRNRLINQAFKLCNKNGLDIYLIMGKIIVEGTPIENMF